MKAASRQLSLVFSAGALGGLANSIAVWACGAFGVTGAFGVALAPAMTRVWLYPRIVWGGIWGALFLLPVMRRSILLRGLVFSVPPTLVQLFIVFPVKARQGVFGFGLGAATPLFVMVFNAVWGIAAAWWLIVSSQRAAGAAPDQRPRSFPM